MNFDWWTFGLQAVNFLILAWLLQRFLYRPVAAIIEQRRQAVGEAERAAEKAEADADSVRQDYESRIAGIDDERRRTLDEAHAQITADREAARKDAQAEAGKRRAEAEEAVEAERTAVLASMKEEIGDLAARMAENLLRDVAMDMPDSASANGIARQLDALSARERDRFRQSIGRNDGVLDVVTAIPFETGDRAGLEQALGEYFGDGTTFTFQVDPGLIGGVELHTPDMQLRRSWKSELETMRKQFAANEKPA